MRLRRSVLAACLTTVALAAGGVAVGGTTTPVSGDREDLRAKALAAGLQTTAKHTERPMIAKGTIASVNPYVGLVPDAAEVDWAYWKQAVQRAGERRSDARGRVPVPFIYDEQEPAGLLGGNDSQANAELVRGFGTGGRQQNAVRISGTLSAPELDTEELESTEDNGSIPLADVSGAGTDVDGVTVDSVIGDGPHGSIEGDGSNDFDFFSVEATAGETITIDTTGSDFDTIVAVYGADGGEPLAVNDDSGGELTSFLQFAVPEDGTYYAMVGGFSFSGGLPADPDDSGSGDGFGEEGGYALELTVGLVDADFYAVRLRPGDVLGGTLSGGATKATVYRVDGEEMVGSQQDASSLYPPNSPLPAAGNATFAYVAAEPGLYAVSATNGTGEYRLGAEVYRPGSETDGEKVVQKVFLDFDGERVNTAIWGGPGVRTLSPFSAFVGRWGLPGSARNQLITRVVRTVEDNLRDELVENGLNDDFRVKVLNSRDDRDPFGNPNVSRVIVGGTIAESGINTIGVAQYIDPGNYGHEDSAVVLLDILSDPAGEFGDPSLNTYLEPSSNKVRFIGTAIGNVTAHEVGHFIGSYHVDQFNDVLNLMDQGGNFPLLYAVGDDGVGGTADDPDVGFGEDVYNPNEGFTGLEDTLNTSAWAFTLGGS